MTNKQLVEEGKRLYSSPLSEEFFVSFEENFMGDSISSSTLQDRYSGSNGSAGGPENPNDFRGGTYDL